ncbi:MAG: hypothetical protein M1828_000880 [Chrysothrix sp. TS-e1954]|nr:MAG: hypothetical protein M1828_000880 [Chrysothrix sp. TS-e1954]
MAATMPINVKVTHHDDEARVSQANGYGKAAAPPSASPETKDHDVSTAFSKQAAQSIAPFLANHIPQRGAEFDGFEDYLPPATPRNKSNTKYCYRHRPDLKCRRQANEPSMDQLQNELAMLPQSDQEGITHVWSLFSAAPSKHRELMLQGILAQCCFPQLSFISAAVRDLIKIDFLSTLPTEIGLRILCFLDPTSICKAAQVSQQWSRLADDDVVWHRMCEQHINQKCTKCGWGLPLLDQKRLRSEKRQIQLKASGKCHENGNGHTQEQETAVISAVPDIEGERSRKRASPSAAETPGTPRKRMRTPIRNDHGSGSDPSPRLQAWKDVYKDRFKIGTNWKYGRHSMRRFRGHNNGVMCLQFDDNILASGSYDSTIKLWNMRSGEAIRTLRGHTLGIRCLQYDESKLVSGSLDRTVKIWDLESGTLLSTLTGHTGGVIGLHFDGSLVASGSEDNTVRLWNFKDKSTAVLRGHTDWVNAVKIDSTSRTLFSASDDCTVCLWDLDTKRCIKTFTGHVGQVQQVLPLPAEFDFTSPEDSSASEPAKNASKLYRDVGDDDNRPLPPKYMLTGGLDSTIRLWNVHTGDCVRTFFGHIEGVWGLAADALRVVSAANDGLVKIWDPQTGKCDRTITNHTAPVTCVGLSDRRICTGSEDHDIRIYSFCSESEEQ